MHAQTLRQYDRLGLVTPSRTRGGGRRYSQRDVALLREVQRLSQEEGVSLPGIARILELENQVDGPARPSGRAGRRAGCRAGPAPGARTRVFSVSPSGDVYAARLGERPRHDRSQALVVWRPLHGGVARSAVGRIPRHYGMREGPAGATGRSRVTQKEAVSGEATPKRALTAQSEPAAKVAVEGTSSVSSNSATRQRRHPAPSRRDSRSTDTWFGPLPRTS